MSRKEDVLCYFVSVISLNPTELLPFSSYRQQQTYFRVVTALTCQILTAPPQLRQIEAELSKFHLLAV